jgi:hypothetical protein
MNLEIANPGNPQQTETSTGSAAAWGHSGAAILACGNIQSKWFGSREI